MDVQVDIGILVTVLGQAVFVGIQYGRLMNAIKQNTKDINGLGKSVRRHDRIISRRVAFIEDYLSNVDLGANNNSYRSPSLSLFEDESAGDNG
jgi:hypothetical protein